MASTIRAVPKKQATSIGAYGRTIGSRHGSCSSMSCKSWLTRCGATCECLHQSAPRILDRAATEHAQFLGPQRKGQRGPEPPALCRDPGIDACRTEACHGRPPRPGTSSRNSRKRPSIDPRQGAPLAPLSHGIRSRGTTRPSLRRATRSRRQNRRSDMGSTRHRSFAS